MHVRMSPRGTLTRAAVTGTFALSVAMVPGAASPTYAAAPAAAEPPRAQRVLGGSVLRPVPVAARLPLQGYRLTGRYGAGSSLWNSSHTGLDFAAPSGTPVRAIGRGTVVFAGYDGRYGNKIVVRLADGTELWFCHLSEARVGPGDPVRAGTVIGTVGTTGNVTGPHLHLEVRPRGGDPVDPETWLEHHHLSA